jgi:hypothetical protein
VINGSNYLLTVNKSVNTCAGDYAPRILQTAVYETIGTNNRRLVIISGKLGKTMIINAWFNDDAKLA